MDQLYGQYDLCVDLRARDGDRRNITLSSSEDDYSDDLEVKEIYGELIQQNKPRIVTIKYLVVNMYYVLIQEQTKSSSRKYWINLANLRHKPKRRLFIEWRWLATAALFPLISAAAYKYIPTSDLSTKAYIMSGILTGCALMAALSLYFFCRRIRYRHVYYSRIGNVPLLELMPGRPDREKYGRFREIMQEHMRLAREKGVIPGDALARELREHRRLNQSGVISDTQYARAKKIILKGHSKLKAI